MSGAPSDPLGKARKKGGGPARDSRRFGLPRAGDEVDPEFLALLVSIDRNVYQLDGRFVVPGTSVRFGWDPVLGLVPVVGDLAGAALAIGLINRARRLGISQALVRRMIVNVAIDVGLGIIPFAGPIIDVFFRANARNLQLLLDEIASFRASPVGLPAKGG